MLFVKTACVTGSKQILENSGIASGNARFFLFSMTG